MPAIDFLKTKKIRDILDLKSKFVQATTSTTLEEGLTTLLKEDETSLPIFDEDQNKYVGLVDMLDVVKFILPDDANQQSISSITMQDIVSSSQKICVMRMEDTLDKVMQRLKDESVHQLLLVEEDEQKQVYRTVSQMDIIRFLSKQTSNESLKDIFQLESNRVKPLGKPLISISHQTSALEGFRKMSEGNVYAIAVLDDDGTIRTTLSSSDFRCEELPNMTRPVVEYLKSIGALYRPVVCSPTELLENSIAKILLAKVHRLWVVNANDKPEGVLALLDIIEAFLEH